MNPANDDPSDEDAPAPLAAPVTDTAWACVTDDPLLDRHAFDAFKDPQFVTAAKQMFRANNDRDKLLVLDNTVGHATDGSIEAAQRFLAGDIDGAIDLWNKIIPRDGLGRRMERRAVKNEDGTVTLVYTNGANPYTFNPHELRGWLLQLEWFLLDCTVQGSSRLQ